MHVSNCCTRWRYTGNSASDSVCRPPARPAVASGMDPDGCGGGSGPSAIGHSPYYLGDRPAGVWRTSRRTELHFRNRGPATPVQTQRPQRGSLQERWGAPRAPRRHRAVTAYAPLLCPLLSLDYLYDSPTPCVYCSLETPGHRTALLALMNCFSKSGRKAGRQGPALPPASPPWKASPLA